MAEKGFFDYFEKTLDVGTSYLGKQDDTKVALAQIRAETVQPQQVVVTAPVESAPITDTSKNTLIFAGVGAGVAVLAILVFALKR